jgi:hypothetical protein
MQTIHVCWLCANRNNSSGEIALGVICGCIPVIPSLYRYYRKKLNGLSTVSKSTKGQSSNSYNGMVPLQEYSSREHINDLK